MMNDCEPEDEDWKIMLECIFPMTIAQFYESFLGDNATFGLDEFGRRMKRTDIKLSKWSKGSDGLLNRVLTCIVPVKTVIFNSTTRNERKMTLIMDDNRIQFDSIIRNLDLPYSDSFQTREKWVVLSKCGMT